MDGRIGNPQDCDPRELSHIKEECHGEPCVRWFTGYWGKCSVTCGNGVETREVACKTFDALPVEERRCDLATKPNTTRQCAMEECLVSILFYYDSFKKCCFWGFYFCTKINS